jgi:N-dimethylarginine dimethylaminohydrolase
VHEGAVGQKSVGSQSMVAPLRRVIVKRPAEAYVDAAKIAAEWRDLAFTGPPDLARAAQEHEAFVALLQRAGAEVLYLPMGQGTTLDSIYAHDPAVVTRKGVVVFNTGKPQRRGEGPALRAALQAWDVPVLGEVAAPAMAEGGDLLWVDENTLVAGRSHRTNALGVARLRELLGPLGVTVIESGLPSWHGPSDLLHLLSLVSPVAEDLAVVYRPLLPIPLAELLEDRGFRLVDVPEEEFLGMGPNVLALRPREVVMVRGLPRTSGALRALGCTVHEYAGDEISHKGGGGPTCLTRPLLRG